MASAFHNNNLSHQLFTFSIQTNKKKKPTLSASKSKTVSGKPQWEIEALVIIIYEQNSA